MILRKPARLLFLCALASISVVEAVHAAESLFPRAHEEVRTECIDTAVDVQGMNACMDTVLDPLLDRVDEILYQLRNQYQEDLTALSLLEASHESWQNYSNIQIMLELEILRPKEQNTSVGALRQATICVVRVYRVRVRELEMIERTLKSK